MPGANFERAVMWLMRHFGNVETHKAVSLADQFDEVAFEQRDLPRDPKEAEDKAEKERFWVCPSCHGEGVIRRIPAPPWNEGEKVA